MTQQAVTASTDKPTILAVDDAPGDLKILAKILKDDYRVKLACNGAAALEAANATEKPDLILLDVKMPDLDGYEVCRRLKSNPLTQNIPVIFVTALDKFQGETVGFDLGAADYITKPIKPVIVRARVRTQLALYDQTRHLETLVRERTQALERTRLQVVEILGRAAELKDEETGLHVVRMSRYVGLLAQAHGLEEDFCKLLQHAAMMHDVGKIGIPDHILRKPDRLDEAEFAEIRRHAEIGARIIGQNADDSHSLIELASIIALTHHEKWDGSGYPHGLAGEDIPLVGRIAAVADVFDALTSDRPYKAAWSIEDAVALLKRERGRHFDPHLVDSFEKILPRIIAVREASLDK
ncbi:response regulator [Thiorhodovibrio frisius]|nr:HD domain-containing phosphohydrolase [Thiorhodovibrio frisius]